MNEVDLDRIVEDATERRLKANAVTLDDFVAYLPAHTYIFTPTRQTWGAGGVDSRVQHPVVNGNPMRPSIWLDKNCAVEEMAWAPGEPTMIKDKLIVKEGGWIARPGCTTFNLYRPPTIQYGDANQANPWFNHVVRVYGAVTADHIIPWLAHRVQRPAEKINHALVMLDRERVGRQASPTAAIIDSQSVKTTEAGVPRDNQGETAASIRMRMRRGWADGGRA